MGEAIEVVRVALGSRSYEIRIANGLVARASEQLASFAPERRLFIVSDDMVWKIAGSRLLNGLGEIKSVPILIAAGEASKSWAGLQFVVEQLLAAGIERRDNVVAFGGGVVGDLAGFAAATRSLIAWRSAAG